MEEYMNEKIENYYNQILDFCNKHGYELITDKQQIKNRESKIKYLCPKHGIYETKLTSILQNKICYDCSRESASKKRVETTLQKRQNVLYSRLIESCNEAGYKLLTTKNELTGYKQEIKYLCPIHGEQTMKAGNLVSGKHCMQCRNDLSRELFQLDKDTVISRIEKCGGALLNPDDYINQDTKNLKILCPRCGNEFVTSLSNFTQHGGQVCKDCYRKESLGELKVRTYLEKHNISYIPQYWFPDCRDINPLPFDFYLLDYNILIEFDGRQHFEETHYFNYSFNKNLLHDQIKNKYCFDNKIKLIRIPFFQINKVDEILEKEIA